MWVVPSSIRAFTLSMPLDREQGGDDDDDAYAHLLGQLEMRQRQLTEAEETVQLFKEK